MEHDLREFQAGFLFGCVGHVDKCNPHESGRKGARLAGSR
jgi:hypothetical protein